MRKNYSKTASSSLNQNAKLNQTLSIFAFFFKKNGEHKKFLHHCTH